MDVFSVRKVKCVNGRVIKKKKPGVSIRREDSLNKIAENLDDKSVSNQFAYPDMIECTTDIQNLQFNVYFNVLYCQIIVSIV